MDDDRHLNIIIGSRGQGKTTELINWLAEGQNQADYPFTTRVVVCIDIRRAKALENRLMEDERFEGRDRQHMVYGLEEWRTAQIPRRGKPHERRPGTRPHFPSPTASWAETAEVSRKMKEWDEQEPIVFPGVEVAIDDLNELLNGLVGDNGVVTVATMSAWETIL